MNQSISWVKSTLYDGLNKQPNSLGKINPKCVLFYIYSALGLKTTHIGLFLTQCFLECSEIDVLLTSGLFTILQNRWGLKKYPPTPVQSLI